MAVAPYKTFTPGEILTAADLNNSILQILNNGDDLASPATKSHDMDGQAILMDADGDSKIQASTNNRFDVTLGGVTLFRLDGTTATSVNGLDLISSATGNAVQVKAVGTDSNISINIVPKGTGTIQINGGGLFESDFNVISQRVFS